MIKATAGPYLILGIDQKNVDFLRAGRPLHINLQELKADFSEQTQILIFYAPTMQDLIATLKPYIGPETRVNEG